MVVKRITQKRYEVTPIGSKPFMKHGAFIATRKRLGCSTREYETCFICREIFAEGDDVYLASVTPGMGNLFLCKECSGKAREGGPQ
jgi:hypothetical protein